MCDVSELLVVVVVLVGMVCFFCVVSFLLVGFVCVMSVVSRLVFGLFFLVVFVVWVDVVLWCFFVCVSLVCCFL